VSRGSDGGCAWRNRLACFGVGRPDAGTLLRCVQGQDRRLCPDYNGGNITASWAAGVKRALEPLGVKFVIRDGNFDIDATSQAITDLIDQKVDVMIVQNTDVQAFAKLYRKAQQAGIYVVQMGMQSVVQTDGYAGPDWSSLGEKMAAAAIGKCGAGSGKSGKVALVQGAVTSANGIFVTQAVETAFKALLR
jgi:ABC-type sugar transport system substrate-binding protein